MQTNLDVDLRDLHLLFLTNAIWSYGLIAMGVFGIYLCGNGSCAFFFFFFFLFFLKFIYFSNHLFREIICSVILFLLFLKKIKHMASGRLPVRWPVLYIRATRWSVPDTNDTILHFNTIDGHSCLLFLLLNIWPPEGCPCSGLFINGRAT